MSRTCTRGLEPKLYKPLYSRTRPTKGSGDDFFSGRVVQNMDRFLVNPRPKPQPKPKPANLMEKVISIKHDESVVENPCLYTVAREWRLDWE